MTQMLISSKKQRMKKKKTATGIFRPLSYRQVNDHVNHIYFGGGSGEDMTTASTELDILVTYLHGQKTLYEYAHGFTQHKYNCVMYPCIFFSAFVTFFTPFMPSTTTSSTAAAANKQQRLVATMVYLLNALVTCGMMVISFAKWDSHANLFMNLALQFESLKVSLEIANNKLLHVEDKALRDRTILEKTHEFETLISDMRTRDRNDYLAVPLHVKKLFPLIAYVNVFSFIKKMAFCKKKLVMQLTDTKNEIRFLMMRVVAESAKAKPHIHRRRHLHLPPPPPPPPPPSPLPPPPTATDTSSSSSSSDASECSTDSLASLASTSSVLAVDGRTTLQQPPQQQSKNKRRIEILQAQQERIQQELLHFSGAYQYIDELFLREIKYTETHSCSFCVIAFCSSRNSCCCPQHRRRRLHHHHHHHQSNNPIVDKYVQFLFGSGGGGGGGTGVGGNDSGYI